MHTTRALIAMIAMTMIGGCTPPPEPEPPPVAGPALPDGCELAAYAPTEGEDPFCPADHDYVGGLVGTPSYWRVVETCNEWLDCEAPSSSWEHCFHCAAWSSSPEYLDPPLVERLAE